MVGVDGAVSLDGDEEGEEAGTKTGLVGEREGDEEEGREDCLDLCSPSKSSCSFASASLCSSVSANTPSTNGF